MNMIPLLPFWILGIPMLLAIVDLARTGRPIHRAAAAG
jgi:hypothetical protein